MLSDNNNGAFVFLCLPCGEVHRPKVYFLSKHSHDEDEDDESSLMMTVIFNDDDKKTQVS